MATDTNLIEDLPEEDAEQRNWEVGAEDHDQRLDKILVRHVPEFSRSYLQTLIDRGCVHVNGVLQTSASRRLRVGQAVSITLLATAESRAFLPQFLPHALNILFEDSH